MDRPPTPSERIARARKELDEATADWQSASEKVDALQAQLDEVTAPLQRELGAATSHLVFCKQRVSDALRRLEAAR